MTKVTYIPREPTDPHLNIALNEIKFPAKTFPVELDPV